MRSGLLCRERGHALRRVPDGDVRRNGRTSHCVLPMPEVLCSHSRLPFIYVLTLTFTFASYIALSLSPPPSMLMVHLVEPVFEGLK